MLIPCSPVSCLSSPPSPESEVVEGGGNVGGGNVGRIFGDRRGCRQLETGQTLAKFPPLLVTDCPWTPAMQLACCPMASLLDS